MITFRKSSNEEYQLYFYKLILLLHEPNIDYYVHSHITISHYLKFILLELTPLGISFAIIVEPSQRRDAAPRSTTTRKTTTSGSGKG
jgi:hypothetical protein